jgi:hypothetical protein
MCDAAVLAQWQTPDDGRVWPKYAVNEEVK